MTASAATIAALLALAADATATTPEEAVLEADSKFWQVYNSCDVEAMEAYFTADLEFYHDRGGLTSGAKALVESARSGLCKPGGNRVRREAIESTIRFDPVPGHGAILTGEHRFYVTEPGKPEHLDGQARFAHVWQLADGNWRMRRVLSYAHGPAHPLVPTAVLKIPAATLAKYAGRYRSATQGVAEFSAEDGRLKAVAGELTLMLDPISETSFSAKDRNLRFDFAADSVSVWENGNKVDEAKRID